MDDILSFTGLIRRFKVSLVAWPPSSAFSLSLFLPITSTSRHSLRFPPLYCTCGIGELCLASICCPDDTYGWVAHSLFAMSANYIAFGPHGNVELYPLDNNQLYEWEDQSERCVGPHISIVYFLC